MPEHLVIATLFTNLQIGGDENRVLGFAQALNPNQADHFVVTMTRPGLEDQTSGPIASRYAEAGIEVISLDEPLRSERRNSRSRAGRLLGDLASVLRMRRRLATLFRQRGVNVVDARMNQAMTMGVIVGAAVGVPVVTGTEYFQDFWVNRCSRRQREYTFRRLDCLISDSEQALDEIVEPLPWPFPRRRMIPNGIPEPRPSFPDKTAARRALGLPDRPGSILIGQVSRMMPHKGHTCLIDAAALVLAEEPDCHFVITGYDHGMTDYRRQLEAQARRRGIRDRITWISYSGPVADAFLALDIHAHATFVDSAPIAIHEGMACGLPIVAANVWGIGYQVEDGVTGFLVPPRQPEALAQALLRLVRDEDLRRRFGAAARRRHENDYRIEIMVQRHLDLWTELLSDARKRGRSAAGRRCRGKN